MMFKEQAFFKKQTNEAIMNKCISLNIADKLLSQLIIIIKAEQNKTSCIKETKKCQAINEVKA